MTEESRRNIWGSISENLQQQKSSPIFPKLANFNRKDAHQ